MARMLDLNDGYWLAILESDRVLGCPWPAIGPYLDLVPLVGGSQPVVRNLELGQGWVFLAPRPLPPALDVAVVPGVQLGPSLALSCPAGPSHLGCRLVSND
jgi:hypothetical protein